MKAFSPKLYSSLLHYLISIIVVFAATGTIWIFRNNLSIVSISLLYLLPVVTSTRLWGLGPGILSALFSFLCLNFFFIPPLFTLAVHQTQDLLALIVFLVIAVVISQLLGHVQESLEVTTAREREATQLYELSVALAGLVEEKAISQILAKKICETFHAQKVEVVIPNIPDTASIACSGEENPSFLLRKSNLTLPLSTTRGQMGSVRIWRNNQPLSDSDEQLLSTFANQGALALERANLSAMENRAKILEESNALKSALLSSVSHELRSPLATIKASISSLRSGDVEWNTEARKELITAVDEETDHLNQLVGNLLDMTRIETGALNPQRKWNSLPEIINSTVKHMQGVLQNHQVVIDISPDIPLVPVDFVQIDQVFSNLLDNSAKYSPIATKIGVYAHLQADQTVLVQITNQGPPVQEGNLERIFEKFYRVTSADKITGTGLGLSICKGIIEAHGGKIWAENSSSGFIFKFSLPTSWEGSTLQEPIEE